MRTRAGVAGAADAADHGANKPAKPELFLLPGTATFDDLLDLFRDLTSGEVEKARPIWQRVEKELRGEA